MPATLESGVGHSNHRVGTEKQDAYRNLKRGGLMCHRVRIRKEVEKDSRSLIHIVFATALTR